VVKQLVFSTAGADDAPELCALLNAASADLTRRYGDGHWSRLATENGTLRRITDSRVIIARDTHGRLAGTVELVTKKPWAIDRAYFTPVKRPLYLLNMAVDVSVQRRGIGRALLAEAERVARAWPAQSICLDAYDASAGAGQFYARCGYRQVGGKVYRGVPLVYYEWLIRPAVD
jgi:GNAT superfamily N-acetyltransferase